MRHDYDLSSNCRLKFYRILSFDPEMFLGSKDRHEGSEVSFLIHLLESLISPGF